MREERVDLPRAELVKLLLDRNQVELLNRARRFDERRGSLLGDYLQGALELFGVLLELV